MIFDKSFLGLQLTFAEHMCELARIPFESALLKYTNLYVRFGFGREFDPTHAGWRSYLAGFRMAANLCEYTHAFYLKSAYAGTAPPVSGKFGCFAWGCEGKAGIRLHFLNGEPGEVSPLSARQADARRAELAALFAHAKSVRGQLGNVKGVSWLYNLEAYRRLFPPTYGDSRRVLRARFQGMSLWGQFVDYRGQLKQVEAEQLLNSLARQPAACEVDRCFPLQVLTAEAPMEHFLAFYGR